MPGIEWTYTISKEPVFADKDWVLLPSFINMNEENKIDDGSWGIWKGSGFQIRELPCYKNSSFFYTHDSVSKCGNCQRTNTICIYLHNTIDQSGANIEAEIYCKDCGFYTAYNGYA